MALTFLVVLTVLCARPTDTPLRTPPPQWQNYAVPALENLAVNFGLLAFSNLVTRESFALISAKTIERNLNPATWTIDADRYVTNQFGHAYQGSLNFNAARSSGLDFWWSALYSLTSSLAWELLFESKAPSVNDQLTTSTAGPLLGEVMHRAALQLRIGGGPRWLRVLGATLLDPFGAINAALLGESPAPATADPLFMRWHFGVSAHVLLDGGEVQTARTLPQAVIGVLLVSGAPWNRQATYDAPLSYFDLRADLAFPLELDAQLLIKGLLLGRRFGDEGVWGLFGTYDYVAATKVRASGIGLGPGVVFQSRVFDGWVLQAVGAAVVSPFAVAGQFDVPAEVRRDYHVGAGMQAVAELRLVKPQVLQLELSARHWLVIGTYLSPRGFEAVTWLTGAVTVPIWRWLGVGAHFAVADRRARFDGERSANDTALTARLVLSVMSEPHFGIGPAGPFAPPGGL